MNNLKSRAVPENKLPFYSSLLPDSGLRPTSPAQYVVFVVAYCQLIWSPRCYNGQLPTRNLARNSFFEDETRKRDHREQRLRRSLGTYALSRRIHGLHNQRGA